MKLKQLIVVIFISLLTSCTTNSTYENFFKDIREVNCITELVSDDVNIKNELKLPWLDKELCIKDNNYYLDDKIILSEPFEIDGYKTKLNILNTLKTDQYIYLAGVYDKTIDKYALFVYDLDFNYIDKFYSEDVMTCIYQFHDGIFVKFEKNDDVYLRKVSPYNNSFETRFYYIDKVKDNFYTNYTMKYEQRVKTYCFDTITYFTIDKSLYYYKDNDIKICAKHSYLKIKEIKENYYSYYFSYNNSKNKVYLNDNGVIKLAYKISNKPSINYYINHISTDNYICSLITKSSFHKSIGLYLYIYDIRTGKSYKHEPIGEIEYIDHYEKDTLLMIANVDYDSYILKIDE